MITGKEKIKIIIITIIIFLVTLGGVTYAYFSISLTGNDEASSMVMRTASLILEYTDGPEIVLPRAFPGTYAEKEVKVENVGTIGVTYAIGFVDMINEFVNDELVVSYTCKSYRNYGNINQEIFGTCDDLEETPIGENPGIEEGITIPVGITHVYTVRIEFIETNSNQASNKGARFSGTINIGESKEAFVLLAQVLNESLEPCVGYTAEIHSRVRSAVTDENGIFRMPKVSKGTHTLIIKDENGIEVLDTSINIEVARTPTVNNNTITGGQGEQELSAQFIINETSGTIEQINLGNYKTLTLELNGGATIQNFKSVYAPEYSLALTTPTKEGSTFVGWSVRGEEATLNNNLLTTGIEGTTLEANWCANNDETLRCKILTGETVYADNVNSTYVQNETPGINFGLPSSETNGRGLYYTTDTTKTENYERVYYYRGAVVNNYVSFAGIIWRIVRINEDNSVKLITQSYVYDRTTPTARRSIAFNTNNIGNKYIGYTYEEGGEQVDSVIKDFIENEDYGWYENISDYASYLVDTGTCNDRTIHTSSGTYYYYGAYGRIQNTHSPRYSCPNPEEDLYTMSGNIKGNGLSRTPAGLLTADEYVYGGGIGTTTDTYLNNAGHWWTASPGSSDHLAVRLWYVYAGGRLYNNQNSIGGSVRPVVSLNPNAIVLDGTGTSDDPYVITQ